MPSKEAIQLATKIVTNAAGVAGVKMGGQTGGIVQFLAAQIDVSVELLSHGATLNPQTLGFILASKGLSIANIAESQEVQCVGSVTSLGVSIAQTAASLPTGPLGIAATGLTVLSSLYTSYETCKVPTQKAAQRLEQQTVTLAHRLYYEFWQSMGLPTPP